MKLLRVGPKGQEKPCLLDATGVIRDLSAHAPDFAGQGVALAALDHIRSLDPATLPAIASGARIGPCLAHVPNFYAIGLNYAKHAAETGMAKPEEPILFSKASTCLAGPNDPLTLPPEAQKADWEVELGVVIGAPAYRISPAQALSHVAGYCLVNDLSERAFQMERGGQWIKGKSLPGFGPIGPWLVTPDEISDPQNLGLELRLNGAVMQRSNTDDMIFSVAEILSYMSRFLELQAGDIIATGTPEGVGLGQKPPRFLRAGDVMELSIDGLGAQRQELFSAPLG